MQGCINFLKQQGDPATWFNEKLLDVQVQNRHKPTNLRPYIFKGHKNPCTRVASEVFQNLPPCTRVASEVFQNLPLNTQLDNMNMKALVITIHLSFQLVAFQIIFPAVIGNAKIDKVNKLLFIFQISEVPSHVSQSLNFHFNNPTHQSSLWSRFVDRLVRLIDTSLHHWVPCSPQARRQSCTFP